VKIKPQMSQISQIEEKFWFIRAIGGYSFVVVGKSLKSPRFCLKSMDFQTATILYDSILQILIQEWFERD
jgi:hypothetical protein